MISLRASKCKVWEAATSLGLTASAWMSLVSPQPVGAAVAPMAKRATSWKIVLVFIVRGMKKV